MEYEKIEALRTRFSVTVQEPTENKLASVRLSGCWVYVSLTLNEALDLCLTSILEHAYRDDSDVISDYKNSKKD